MNLQKKKKQHLAVRTYNYKYISTNQDMHQPLFFCYYSRIQRNFSSLAWNSLLRSDNHSQKHTNTYDKVKKNSSWALHFVSFLSPPCSRGKRAFSSVKSAVGQRVVEVFLKWPFNVSFTRLPKFRNKGKKNSRQMLRWETADSKRKVRVQKRGSSMTIFAHVE